MKKHWFAIAAATLVASLFPMGTTAQAVDTVASRVIPIDVGSKILQH